MNLKCCVDGVGVDGEEIASRIGMERLFCEIKVKYKRELE
jgi:hypothetical protein